MKEGNLALANLPTIALNNSGKTSPIAPPAFLNRCMISSPVKIPPDSEKEGERNRARRWNKAVRPGVPSGARLRISMTVRYRLNEVKRGWAVVIAQMGAWDMRTDHCMSFSQSFRMTSVRCIIPCYLISSSLLMSFHFDLLQNHSLTHLNDIHIFRRRQNPQNSRRNPLYQFHLDRPTPRLKQRIRQLQSFPGYMDRVFLNWSGDQCGQTGREGGNDRANESGAGTEGFDEFFCYGCDYGI